MPRKITHLLPVAPERWDSTADGESRTTGRAQFQFMRDQLRTDMAAVGLTVGDIAIWTVGSVEGMVFELHDAAANSSFYIIGGTSATTSSPDIDDVLGGSGANLRTRVKQMSVSFAAASASPGSGLVFGANVDTSISRADLEYDNLAAMTYSGGDFTPLTTFNPDSLAGLQALFPLHSPYAMDTHVVNGLYRTAHCLGYDSDEECWLFMSAGSGSEFQGHCLWGPIIDPSAGGDTNEYGLLYVYGEVGTATDNRGIGHTQRQVNAAGADGTWQDPLFSTTGLLNVNNYKIAGGPDDGKLNWRKVQVDSGNMGGGIKGHIKGNLFVEIGPINDGRFLKRAIEFPDVDHPVICYTHQCAMWWERGQRMFPSYVRYNP